MENIKAGTVAYIKATDEPVFVLALNEGPLEMQYPKLSVPGTYAWVRRPRAGNDGVQHSVELFMTAELETLEEGQNRKVSEMEELKARFGPKGVNGDGPASTSNMVLPN